MSWAIGLKFWVFFYMQYSFMFNLEIFLAWISVWDLERWHYLVVSFFLAKTHTWLVHLVLSHCVTQKLHNNPYSMTLHHRYKAMPWLNTVDLPIALNLESLEVAEHSAETTNHLSGSSPFSPSEWRQLRDCMVNAEAFTAKVLMHYRKMAQLCASLRSAVIFHANRAVGGRKNA